jgi:predicted kinase
MLSNSIQTNPSSHKSNKRKYSPTNPQSSASKRMNPLNRSLGDSSLLQNSLTKSNNLDNNESNNDNGNEGLDIDELDIPSPQISADPQELPATASSSLTTLLPTSISAVPTAAPPSTLLAQPSEIPTITLSQPTLLIMRGIPGSGKSFLAKKFVDFAESSGHTSALCSADDYFLNSAGQYNYNSGLIGQAHAVCLGKYLSALQQRAQLIIIDNTNSQRWEYQNFLKLAEMFNYSAIIVEMNCANESVASVFNARNLHSVPNQSNLAMLKRWEKDSKALLLDPYFSPKDLKEYDRITNEKSLNAQRQQQQQQYFSNGQSNSAARQPRQDYSGYNQQYSNNFQNSRPIANNNFESAYRPERQAAKPAWLGSLPPSINTSIPAHNAPPAVRQSAGPSQQSFQQQRQQQPQQQGGRGQSQSVWNLAPRGGRR